MSGIFRYNGNIQFPNPPITIGMIKKKIIIKAWLVTITLYSCPLKYTQIQFNRIIIEYLNPTNPINVAKIMYSVPISLWFTLKNQRFNNFKSKLLLCCNSSLMYIYNSILLTYSITSAWRIKKISLF